MVGIDSDSRTSSAENSQTMHESGFGRNTECDFCWFQINGVHPLLLQIVLSELPCFLQSLQLARGEAPSGESIVRNEMEGYDVKAIFSISQPHSGGSMVEIVSDSGTSSAGNARQCTNLLSDERPISICIANCCS